MGRWAIEMNRRLAATLGADTQRTFLWPFQGAAQDGLATDGFHPGPAGYELWAVELNKLIFEKLEN